MPRILIWEGTYPPDSTIVGIEFTGTSPVFQAALRSTFEINEDIDASIGLRRISEFESEAVGAYTDLDIPRIMARD